MSTSDIPAAVAIIEKMLTWTHDEIDDCWYSCPKSGDCCDERADRNTCTCGKDHRDALLRDVLKHLGVPQAQPAAEPVTLDVSARSEG
jgi:hypothetical protein